MNYFSKIKSLINVTIFWGGKDNKDYNITLLIFGLPIVRISKVYLP